MTMAIPKGVVGKAGPDGLVYGFKYKLFPSLRCLGCSVGGGFQVYVPDLIRDPISGRC